MKIILVFLFSISSILLADSCWTQQSKSKIAMDELNGVISISAKDASSCDSLIGATMQIQGKTIVSDNEGVFKIPLNFFENIGNNDIPIKIEKNNYISSETNLIVRLGLVWNKFFVLSKELKPQSVRVVLEWGNSPKDLDLHLVSNNFHISYNNMKNYENQAMLDIDSRNGYGPETITLDFIEEGKPYRFYVENYSKEVPFDAMAKATIFANNKQQKIVKIPRDSNNTYELFTIENGKIVFK